MKYGILSVVDVTTKSRKIEADPLTRYKRWKLRAQLAASHTWTVEYVAESMPCALCVPGKQRVTLTLVRGTYTSYQHRRYGLPVCYVCLGKLALKRERQQPLLERRWYGIKTTPI